MAGSPVIVRGWDRAGLVVSAACAVHCAVLPALLAAVSVVGLGQLLDDRVEWSFIVVSAVIGSTAHLRAYRQNHRHAMPGLIFVAGFLIVLGSRLLLESHPLTPWAAVIGGALAAASHYANLKLCRCCDTHAIDASGRLHRPDHSPRRTCVGSTRDAR
jgi:hypothetical protein